MVSETTHSGRTGMKHLEAVIWMRFSRGYKIEFIREFKTARNSFITEFRRQFNSEVLNQIRFVTKQRLVSRRWRLYSYSNLVSVIIICSYDLWVSNKSIHLIQNPLLLVTLTRNTWLYRYFNVQNLISDTFLLLKLRFTCHFHLWQVLGQSEFRSWRLRGSGATALGLCMLFFVLSSSVQDGTPTHKKGSKNRLSWRIAYYVCLLQRPSGADVGNFFPPTLRGHFLTYTVGATWLAKTWLCSEYHST
jgi:hypothetical protein